MKSPYTTIDEYIQAQPQEVQKYLYEIRSIIEENAPQATSKISWGMPTYVYHGNLVHFAAAKLHTGFYPGEDGVAYFEDRLQAYKHSKGAIQFPYQKPLPHNLIKDIVQFRLQQNEKK